MTEHAAELMPLLTAIIGFMAVYVLNGIKSEIKEVKTTVQRLEADLRGGVSELDRRIAKLEARCESHHD